MRNMKKILAAVLTATMVCSLPVLVYAEDATTTGEAATTEGTTEALTVDLNGTYNARLGIQGTTSDGVTWMERIGYYQSPDGDVVHTGTEGKDDYVAYDTTFTDAVIEGNGTYTVSMLAKDMPLSIITQLQVATDIPNTGDITFSNLVVKVNNMEKATYSDVYVDADPYAEPYACLLAYNNWRNELKALTGVMNPNDMPSTGEVTYELTFTVSGFAYDKVEEETTPAETSESATTVDSAEDDSDDSSDNSTIYIVVGVVAAVVVLAVAGCVIVAKKKK